MSEKTTQPDKQVELHWKTGFEIELLAPVGKSRQDIAELLAERMGGQARRFFFADSEPSKVPGQKLFFSLAPGFEVLDANGDLVARFVDDITLQDDLNKQAKPTTDWYRIVSDDRRLLHLVERHADPNLPIEKALNLSAELFGTKPIACDDGIFRLADNENRSIAMASGLPGERERACEIVSAPLVANHQLHLEHLLAAARELGFTAPQEAALHIHFDGSRLCEVPVLQNLGALLYPRRQMLRKMLSTNPSCRRLGPWPDTLIEILRNPESSKLSWPQLVSRFNRREILKYCDFNIRNLLFPPPNKKTFEVRLLPVSLEASAIVGMAKLFELVLEKACDSQLLPWTDEVEVSREEGQAFLDLLRLNTDWATKLLQRLPPAAAQNGTGQSLEHIDRNP